jgi:uncharacterized protein
MKKVFLFIWFLFSVISFGQSQIPILKNWANDYTNTLTQSQLAFLYNDLSDFNDTTSNQIVLLMIHSLNNYPLENFTYETAAKNNIGTKKNNNGILFFIAKNDRKMRIEVGYGLEGALPDALCSSILRNEVMPYFQQDEYFEGIKAGIDAIKLATKGEYVAIKKKSQENGVRGLGSFFLILAIIIISFISKIGRGGRGGRGGGFIFFPGGGIFGGGGSWGSSGGGGGGFGGFSGGGGSFGGGGASGSW